MGYATNNAIIARMLLIKNITATSICEESGQIKTIK